MKVSSNTTKPHTPPKPLTTNTQTTWAKKPYHLATVSTIRKITKSPPNSSMQTHIPPLVLPVKLQAEKPQPTIKLAQQQIPTLSTS